MQSSRCGACGSHCLHLRDQCVVTCDVSFLNFFLRRGNLLFEFRLRVKLVEKGIQMLSVQPDTKPKGCAGCNRKIKDRYLLKALDKYWHEDCLKCACCDCRLGEVGSTLYTKANLILCRRDYLRLFGVTGNCAACSKLIPAFEMVMRAKENVYHLDCFACQLCNQRFCVGDKFFLKNNMILCQTDYEEGLMKEGYAPQVR
ncbi:LIM domain only protein 3 isoform X1 [Archocentrus centrarchus]|uniref:LIM domain only protein 3 isoform X1 n=1 Tax=Archocentrus centrarchus TaxID=63155 RepID=UPI0011EA0A1E|nr:LIM domain only protein 3 isoform X1 [Archocentrus centrarchus]